MTPSVLQKVSSLVGASHVSTDADVLAGRSVDHTGRYRGRASALVRPGSADEVAEVLRVCRDAGTHVTIQGGRTSLVAGTVPEHDDVLLCTERLRASSDVDTTERRVEVGAGATLAAVQRAASAAGLVFGVDLAARDTATVGGMASTSAPSCSKPHTAVTRCGGSGCRRRSSAVITPSVPSAPTNSAGRS